MESLDAELDSIWNQLWELEHRLKQGESLELGEDVRDLLRRAAPTVAISEAEAASALLSVERATDLLRKMRARVRDGSNRIMDALDRMYRLEEREDYDGARQQMRDVLAVEVVPHYRDMAEGQLERLSELP